MRIYVLLITLLSLSCASVDAGERYAGFLTFGCGDGFLKSPDILETWFVDLPTKRQQQLFELAQLYREEDRKWWTFYVELDGRLEGGKKPGFFSDHPKELRVARFITARYPEVGESVKAATAPARRYRGYFVFGDESAGFVPEHFGDELWWITAGKVSWDQISKLVPPSKEDLYGAFVEIVGRIGPPGAFGHLLSYNREIVVDEVKVLRRVAMNELTSTVAVGMFGTGADIEKCRRPRE